MYTSRGIKKAESIAGYRLSEEARELLKKIVKLVMETEYFKPDTKNFLISKSRNYRNDEFRSICAKNKHTCRSRIFYDLAKLRAALGTNAMDIIIKQPRADLTIYKDIIQDLLMKYGEKRLIDGFTIKLPKVAAKVTSIPDEDYEILREIAKYGSKKGKMLMEFNMTPEIVGYLQYLDENKDKLSSKETERYNELSAWLK